MNPKTSAQLFAENLNHELAQTKPGDVFSLDVPGTTSLAAWFLGPKAENEQLLKDLVADAIGMHCTDRREFFPNDPPYVTEEIKKSAAYKDSVKVMREEYQRLLEKLKGSVPFFSYRYQAHMNWDITLPGVAGYFAGMLYNQNNVASEASPVTTPLEMIVGDDLCELLGYHLPPKDDTSAIRPWGHITCDGSIANLEAMWSARNMKFYPAAVVAALTHEPSLAAAKNMTVRLPNGQREVLTRLTPWQQLNLEPDVILSIPTVMVNGYGISSAPNEGINLINNYTVQQLGYAEFARRYLRGEVGAPVVIGPATMHYSWPKAAAILGIGQNNLVGVDVDINARMAMPALRAALDRCLAEHRPVILNVSVLGSTEESAVDPLDAVIALRDEYRGAGFSYPVHVDAAWGGYFAAILRAPKQEAPLAAKADGLRFTPDLAMSDYVTEQYEALPGADSITIDPHKAGYIPYPAGGLCYRNGAQRNLVSFTAPVVYKGTADPTVGIYGVEGSKPGAAAAGVYLSHRVIRTNQSGYGKILGQSLFNSKRLYAALVTMALEEDSPFVVVPFQRLPAEQAGGSKKEIREQLQYIAREIVPKSNEELLRDPQAMQLLTELGSDQIIVSYAFNYRLDDGVLNRNVEMLNALNTAIYNKCSLQPNSDHTRDTPIILTNSAFDPSVYGHAFVEAFKERLGVQGDPQQSISFLLSTTMDPWMTSTEKGNFIPTLIDALRKAVLNSIREIKAQPITMIEAREKEKFHIPLKAGTAAAIGTSGSNGHARPTANQ
jgi:glutamate/tyrosine decarboxylase-like PLP-dependent enzyme